VIVPAARFGLIAAALAVVAACGVRTEPRPPEDTAARAPDGFRVKTVESGVELRWERTTKAMDGERLYDLASFVVERRSDGGAFQTIATIPVTDTDRVRTQRVFRYVDDEPVPASEYRVRAVTADGERGVPTETVGVTAPATPAGNGKPSTEDEPHERTAPAARSR
jgi:hypothetical protein